jgi:hypothetical protein
MNLFKTPWAPGGLESITSHIGEEDEAFGPEFGNRIASERVFGKPEALAHYAQPMHRSAGIDAGGLPRRRRSAPDA